MIYFCSDLDNTLIYSYRREIGNDKVLVEMTGQKELSYMTSNSYQMLKKISRKYQFVPVTTRSLNQYQRIKFGEDVRIRYALAANGGILLENGKVNENWLKTSKEMVQDSKKEMKLGILLLAQDPNLCFEVREVDQLFVFTKSNDAGKTVSFLKEHLDENKVYIDRNGLKVYIFPKVLDKGNALRRFHQMIGLENPIIAAGDSEFDIPMLKYAKVGLAPGELEIQDYPSVFKFNRETFSDDLLNYVLNIKQNT